MAAALQIASSGLEPPRRTTAAAGELVGPGAEGDFEGVELRTTATSLISIIH